MPLKSRPSKRRSRPPGRARRPVERLRARPARVDFICMAGLEHRITNIDAESRTATCARCGPVSIVFKPGKSGHGWRCAVARKEQWEVRDLVKRRIQKRDYRIRHAHRDRLHRKYRLTVEVFDAMVAAQNGVCAICSQPCATHSRLSVDHDHSTGLVRALLCRRCNSGLGHFGDNPRLLRLAADYLDLHNEKTAPPAACEATEGAAETRR